MSGCVETVTPGVLLFMKRASLFIALGLAAVTSAVIPPTHLVLAAPPGAAPARHAIHAPHHRARLSARPIRRTTTRSQRLLQRPAVRAGAFPVLNFAGGRTGTVYARVQGTRTFLTVHVAGLPAGSLHSIHVHAGSCGNPYAGMHLYVLGILASDMKGDGAMTGFGPNPYIPGTRYVIVYADLSAARIIGCANLGTVSG